CPCQQARSIELKALPQYLPNFESAPAAKGHDMVDIIVYVMPEIVQMMPRLSVLPVGLLKYRMAAAFAVVLGLGKPLTVVVIEDDMLAFEADDIANAVQVFGMFGDDERSGAKRRDHA